MVVHRVASRNGRGFALVEDLLCVGVSTNAYSHDIAIFAFAFVIWEPLRIFVFASLIFNIRTCGLFIAMASESDKAGPRLHF